MPIMTPKPTAPQTTAPLAVRPVEPPFRGVTVDSRYNPLTSILQHVEGSNWAVSYYSQMLDINTELGPQQTDRSAVYQQYTLVKGLELKVSTPLTSAQDPVSKEFTVTGSAIVYPGLIPNKGDQFFADAGDGREGYFVVTTAEKKTYLKDSFYSIEYELKSYSALSVREDLDKKVVKTTHFVKEFLQFGQNPQILTAEYDHQIVFRKRYKELLGLYLGDFFSVEHHTLVIPGQGYPTYDPFLTKAFLDWVASDDHPIVARIRLPGVSGDQAMRAMSLWDCLTKLSDDLLPMAFQKARLIDTIHFRTFPQQRGVYFTTLRQVVYPQDRRTDVDAGYEVSLLPSGSTPFVDGGVRFDTLARLIPTDILNGIHYAPSPLGTLPDIVRVTHDDFYVLSEGFYTQKVPLVSNLERLVRQALRQETIDSNLLESVSENATHWGNLERFYYFPLLFVLFKTALRSN